jgi:hypothetical protein
MAMSLNPLTPITNYQSMLNRIFWFTTASAFVAVWMLRLHIAALDAALGTIDFTLPVHDGAVLPTPGGYLLPALAIGLATRIFRLHARISDWLGIRECFDLEVIIGGMARQLSIDLQSVKGERLRRARHDVMRKAFYPFVSPSSPQIDAQLILQALDAWSWFWIGLEAALIFTLSAFVLIASAQYMVGFQTLVAALCFAHFGLPALRAQCKRYAMAQVRAILSDPARASAVRTAFAELAGEGTDGRVAA